MKGGVSEDTVWAIVEAYLFEEGKAASLEELVSLFKGVFTAEELEASLERMEKNRWEERRGILLVARKGLWALEVRGRASLSEKWTLKKEDGGPPEEWSEREKTVLAIIAYEGPVSLDRIDQIMGSECSHLVILLQERGLVKKKGGKVEVTPSFYGFFGIENHTQLPSLQEKENHDMVFHKKEIGLPFDCLSEKNCIIDTNDTLFDSSWSI